MNVTKISKPNDGLPRFMLLQSPENSSDTILVYKSRYPSYIIEISSRALTSASFKYIFKGFDLYVTVRKDFDSCGNPSKSHLDDLCTWYTKNGTEPSIKKISR
ncbi:hypothetical protein [Arundinibacter roseus]|uniref:Uncharacterized protein n=1 Tax=Arundinibacter roseus TaxID=2070510 RepID=A0A4R4K0U1_9BACT|nr:hypothetical protein [Arundinibacter roseus]TDB60016.1 hypothetical protein EZE20_21320 [Arundinibacter roseus]